MNVFYGICIIWGIVSFLQGLAGAFTLNSIHVFDSIIAIVFGFLIVLPTTIAAVWKPKLSAKLLLFSFLAVECTGLHLDGVRGAVQVARRLALPTFVLVSGYSYAGFIRGKSHQESDTG